MSARFFQSVIVQMKEATDKVIGVIDSDGIVVACNALNMMGAELEGAAGAIAASSSPVVLHKGRAFRVLGGIAAEFDYAAFVEGEDENSRTVCMLASIAFNEAKSYYEEKYDKTTFIKNIISENTLLVDMFARAKELRIDLNIPRGVLLVRQAERWMLRP